MMIDIDKITNDIVKNMISEIEKKSNKKCNWCKNNKTKKCKLGFTKVNLCKKCEYLHFLQCNLKDKILF